MFVPCFDDPIRRNDESAVFSQVAVFLQLFLDAETLLVVMKGPLAPRTGYGYKVDFFRVRLEESVLFKLFRARRASSILPPTQNPVMAAGLDGGRVADLVSERLPKSGHAVYVVLGENVEAAAVDDDPTGDAANSRRGRLLLATVLRKVT